jgi:ubiquinone/menaquinone biosynthesis C-methylase UbiE
MSFKDHFSAHASDYARFRPHYPRELFAYLAALTSEQECVWDCATGNGQAAVALGEFFQHVIATDASEKQVANGRPHDRVTYRVAPAERSGLSKASMDLITVAQALHWFDREAFFTEAKRVLKPNGILAVWCYDLFRVSPEIDRLVETFYRKTVGPYWDFERRLVETGYRTIEFPFDEISSPDFRMQADWSLDDVLGYLRTWSATKGFIAARGFDPVVDLRAQLRAAWGESETRKITWPLSVRVGRSL